MENDTQDAEQYANTYDIDSETLAVMDTIEAGDVVRYDADDAELEVVDVERTHYDFSPSTLELTMEKSTGAEVEWRAHHLESALEFAEHIPADQLEDDDSDLEFSVDLSGVVRTYVEEEARAAFTGDELAEEVLGRFSTVVRVESKEEAEAVLDVVRSTKEDRSDELKSAQKRALRRVAGRLEEIRAEYDLEAIEAAKAAEDDEDDVEEVVADGGEDAEDDVEEVVADGGEDAEDVDVNDVEDWESYNGEDVNHYVSTTGSIVRHCPSCGYEGTDDHPRREAPDFNAALHHHCPDAECGRELHSGPADECDHCKSNDEDDEDDGTIADDLLAGEDVDEVLDEADPAVEDDEDDGDDGESSLKETIGELDEDDEYSVEVTVEYRNVYGNMTERSGVVTCVSPTSITVDTLEEKDDGRPILFEVRYPGRVVSETAGSDGRRLTKRTSDTRITEVSEVEDASDFEWLSEEDLEPVEDDEETIAEADDIEAALDEADPTVDDEPTPVEGADSAEQISTLYSGSLDRLVRIETVAGEEYEGVVVGTDSEPIEDEDATERIVEVDVGVEDVTDLILLSTLDDGHGPFAPMLAAYGATETPDAVYRLD